MIQRFVLALAVLACASSAAAQAPAPPPAFEFLPRAVFHLAAEHLSHDDERYVWDANFGGTIDLLGYPAGRATFFGNYQTILGEELRNFDPNQGNYILAALASARVRSVEIAGQFHHESRHLSDRPKRDPVDWNMVGVRLQQDATAGAAFLSSRLDVRKVILKSFVDYTWEVDGRLRYDAVLRPAVGMFVGVGARLMAVDGSRDRGNQTGFRAEGGVRLDGRAAAVELFVASERRIDPYPLEFGTANWMTAGFRLLSR